MKEDFALIIGINDYTPADQYGLRSLGGAINDACMFEEWVTRPDGGNVDPGNCFKIVSTPLPLRPIQDEIDSGITDMFTKIRQRGNKAKRLYFYFAGHGLGSMDNVRDTALCLANWSEIRRNTALSSEAYKEGINSFGFFEEIIFIADCCRNTKINVKPMHPTFAPLNIPPAAGMTRLFVGYATQYQDQSFEIEVGDSEMRGVFTKVLLEGLEGAAANSQGVISADSLRDYLVKNTPVEAQSKGYKQIPDINHSFTAAVPIIELTRLKAAKSTCRIQFNPGRNNRIQLIDSNLEEIGSYDASTGKQVEIDLPKGLYLLVDTVTQEQCPIKVSPVNPIIDVTF